MEGTSTPWFEADRLFPFLYLKSYSALLFCKYMLIYNCCILESNEISDCIGKQINSLDLECSTVLKLSVSQQAK